MTDLIQDVTCAVFSRIRGELEPNAIHRFVVGEDQAPKAMSPDEAAKELGDPVATLLLLRGTFPRTPSELLAGIDSAVTGDDPLRNQMSFLVGEGSKIPVSAETGSLDRGFRFLVTRGAGPEGPDVMLSAPDPDGGFIEVMAWDRQVGGFNYYRTVGDNSAWVWAGNSRHALSPATEGKGPFESHPSGNLVMKELQAPWINWHSVDANIFEDVFAADSPLRSHPWFVNKVPQGALVLETQVARPSIERWTSLRFEKLLASGGTIDRPSRIMEQILDTPTVNLISSRTESLKAPTSASMDLPGAFFIDTEGLNSLLGLPSPPGFSVGSPIYGASLQRFEARLTDDQGFTQTGDTFFAFVVPERALEDQVALRKSKEIGLVSDRFAACLLMTDFPNPVFSARRAALLRHVPASATVSGGQSGFSEEMANAILRAAEQSPDDSPQREFAERWGKGEAWREEFGRLLGEYFAAVTQRLGTQEGFDDYYRLAESRRERVRAMPIFENPLLFARTNLPPEQLVMRPDGTVESAG